MTTKDEYHRQNVQRAANVDAAAAAFGSRHAPGVGVSKASHSIGRNMLDVGTSAAVQPVQKAKADRSVLHQRVKSVESRLTDNGARALDFIVRKDEAFGGSRLVDVVVHQLASALDLPEKDAEAARNELETLGLVKWYDNFSGDRGYRPKV